MILPSTYHTTKWKMFIFHMKKFSVQQWIFISIKCKPMRKTLWFRTSQNRDSALVKLVWSIKWWNPLVINEAAWHVNAWKSITKRDKKFWKNNFIFMLQFSVLIWIAKRVYSELQNWKYLERYLQYANAWHLCQKSIILVLMAPPRINT